MFLHAVGFRTLGTGARVAAAQKRSWIAEALAGRSPYRGKSPE